MLVMQQMDIWNLYFDLPLNGIQLTFQHDQLIQIYRNRRLIEGT